MAIVGGSLDGYLSAGNDTITAIVVGHHRRDAGDCVVEFTVDWVEISVKKIGFRVSRINAIVESD